MFAHVLRGIILLIGVVSLLAASTKEETLEKLDEEFDVTNIGDQVVEEKKPSFDNAMVIEEGQFCVLFFFPEVMKEVHNLTKLKKKHKDTKLDVLWAGTKKIQQHRLRRFNDSPFFAQC